MRKFIMILSLTLLAFHVGNESALARPKVSLVLGGGAARGISHIGLLKAFEEEGIPIDYIVGTSMGSVIAGLYSAGLSADNLHYLATHVNLDELFTPMVPPKGGFLSTERFEEFIDALTDEAYFESLPIPFSTVVLNLVSGEEVTIREGKLSPAIIASMAIPAVFPPARIGDDYFVDGGMRSLVPVEVAQRDNPDLTIAVDVRSQLENVDHETILSNVQLASMLVLATDTNRQLELADIVIAPGVSYESYMDYDRSEFFIAQGYEAAKAAIPGIRAALTELDPDFTHVSPPFSGYSPEDFAARLHAAVDEAQNGGSSNGTPTLRLALGVDDKGRTTTGFDVTFPLTKLADQVPAFGRFSSQKHVRNSIKAFNFGVGNCERTCFSLFGRHAHGDPHWGAGAALEGKTPGNWRYAGEWEQSSTLLGWTLSATGPIRPNHPGSTSELQVIVGQDPRGVHRHVTESLGTTVLYRYYYPFNRAAFWEAINTSTHVYLGVGMNASTSDESMDWQPVGEMGLAFEARLFGLYPIRSGLTITYSGPKTPWSLRWTFGEW